MRLKTVIGIFPHEREVKQEVIISVEIETDLKKAGITGDLSDSLDYFDIYNQIINLVEKSNFLLLESLAEKVSEIILSNKQAKSVKIRISKPSALERATAAVEIERKQN